MNAIRMTFAAAVLGLSSLLAPAVAQTIDNSAIGKPEFREHKATYGLVYRLCPRM